MTPPGEALGQLKAHAAIAAVAQHFFSHEKSKREQCTHTGDKLIPTVSTTSSPLVHLEILESFHQGNGHVKRM